MKKILLTLFLVGFIAVEGFCVINNQADFLSFSRSVSAVTSLPSSANKDLYLKHMVESYLAISDQLPSTIQHEHNYIAFTYSLETYTNSIENYYNSGDYSSAMSWVRNTVFQIYRSEIYSNNYTPGENVTEAQTVINTNNFLSDLNSYNNLIVNSTDDDPFLMINVQLGLIDPSEIPGNGNGNGANIPIDGGISFLLLGGLGFGVYKMRKS